MSSSKRKRVHFLVKAAGAAILLVIVSAGFLRYSIWSAERSARMFCEQIALGSDVDVAVSRAKDKKILYGAEGGYTFYFPTVTGFDKAVCGAAVDPDGKVISKAWQMEFD